MSDDLATRMTTKAISDTDLAAGRTTTRIQVAAAVWTLWARLRAEQGVDQQWLADRLGKNKSRVSRLLKGPGNWTLDTVGDLLEAMGGRLTKVEAHTYQEIAQGMVAKSGYETGRRTIVRIATEVIMDDVGWGKPATARFEPYMELSALRPLTSLHVKQVETT